MFGRGNKDSRYEQGYEAGYQAGYVAGRLSKQQEKQSDEPKPTIRTLTGETLHGFQTGHDVGEEQPPDDGGSEGGPTPLPS